MEKVKKSKLFKKTLVIIIGLFALISVVTCFFSGTILYKYLTDEYISKGTTIAKTIAETSVEIILNHDHSTIQSTIDQFLEIDGVSYLYVLDTNNEIISHTFTPYVPNRLINKTKIESTIIKKPVDSQITIRRIDNSIDIEHPILLGKLGIVHVGMNLSIIIEQIKKEILRLVGIIFIIFLFSVYIAFLLIKNISKPLIDLTNYSKLLANHDFQKPLDFQDKLASTIKNQKDEIGTLASAFVKLEMTLIDYIENLKEKTKTNQKIQSELNIASDIQMSMLPIASLPGLKKNNYSFASFIKPAKEVGGDFYDYYFDQDNQKFHFILGDVSGKGVPAALFMAITLTLIRTANKTESSPSEILNFVNNLVCEDNEATLFVTVYYGVLDIKTNKLTYVLAGHNPPYHITKKEVIPLDLTEGMALGIDETFKYKEKTIQLNDDSQIFIFTDGITEAHNKNGKLYGDEKLESHLKELSIKQPKTIIDTVYNSVEKFAKGRTQFDDITMISLKKMDPLSKFRTMKFDLSNNKREITKLQQKCELFFEKNEISNNQSMKYIIVLEEIVSNIILYGFTEIQNVPKISIKLTFKNKKIETWITDNSHPFNPFKDFEVEDIDLPLDEKNIGGLGIHLVKTIMDHYEYSFKDDKNIIYISKSI
ncbi:SpoIIE family protein phosphatase [bacterium]|jgi:phosphoserine phosphatase RsbU/P|nr:SpoIIE family protein phosphatase [bacterium]